jgi:hypothetical protein
MSEMKQQGVGNITPRSGGEHEQQISATDRLRILAENVLGIPGSDTTPWLITRGYGKLDNLTLVTALFKPPVESGGLRGELVSISITGKAASEMPARGDGTIQDGRTSVSLQQLENIGDTETAETLMASLEACTAPLFRGDIIDEQPPDIIAEQPLGNFVMAGNVMIVVD